MDNIVLWVLISTWIPPTVGLAECTAKTFAVECTSPGSGVWSLSQFPHPLQALLGLLPRYESPGMYTFQAHSFGLHPWKAWGMVRREAWLCGVCESVHTCPQASLSSAFTTFIFFLSKYYYVRTKKSGINGKVHNEKQMTCPSSPFQTPFPVPPRQSLAPIFWGLLLVTFVTTDNTLIMHFPVSLTCQF